MSGESAPSLDNPDPRTTFSRTIAERLGAKKVFPHAELDYQGFAVVLEDDISLFFVHPADREYVQIILLYPHPAFGPCIPPQLFNETKAHECFSVTVHPEKEASVLDDILGDLVPICRQKYVKWSEAIEQLDESQPEPNSVKMYGQTFGPKVPKVAFWMDSKTIWRRSKVYGGCRLGREWKPSPLWFGDYSPFESWLLSWHTNAEQKRLGPKDSSMNRKQPRHIGVTNREILEVLQELTDGDRQASGRKRATKLCIIGALPVVLLAAAWGSNKAWAAYQQHQRLAANAEKQLEWQIEKAEKDYDGVVRRAWVDVLCHVDHKPLGYVEPVCDPDHGFEEDGFIFDWM